MRQINEGTALTGVLGTVLTPGTATGTNIDFTPTYEPSVVAVANVGAISAGSAVVTVTGGTALGDASVTYGSVVANGAGQGTTTYTLSVPSVWTRYIGANVVMAGGTVTPISVAFLAKKFDTA